MNTYRLVRNSFAATIAALLIFTIPTAVHAVPLFVATPSDGGELDDKLSFVFTQPMEDPIAIEFSGTGDAVMGCGWNVIVAGQPLQFLDCTVTSGELPSGATITWTMNPGGEGMTTLGGMVLPEASGTFTAPTRTDVTISVSPSDGATYDPEVDGPVVFTFNVPMSQSLPAISAVTFDTGEWNVVWLANRTTLQCILSGDPVPGVYGYSISGLTSAEGVTAPDLSGSFTIEDDPTGGGGDVEIFPSPGEGEALMPLPGQPTQVLFVFSESMDPSIDIDAAITFSMGEWDCSWTQILPTLPVNGCSCIPVGVLPGGTYEYTLSGLKTEQGGTVPDFMGTFLVDGPGTGGGGEITGGIPAPLCEEDAMLMPFPKSMYVCGPDMFSWTSGSLLPSTGGGYLFDGAASVTGGSLASLILMDDTGMQTGGILATDVGVRLDGWPDLGLSLVTQGGTPVQPDVSFGVFDVTGASPVNTFQHRLAVGGDNVTASLMPGGEVLMVRDDNDVIEAIVFNANGSVKWAKRYSAATFGVDTSNGGASSQNVSLSPVRNGGFLLVVSKREVVVEIDGGSATTTRTASAIVARLNANGAVQWSRVYSPTDEMDSLNATGPFEDGSIVLSGSLSGGGVEGGTTTTSLIARADENGNLLWRKKIDGAFLSAMGTTQFGKVLIGGGQGAGTEFDAVFLMMGITGLIENQVRIDVSDVDVGFASVLDNQIVFSIVSNEIPSIEPNAPETDTTTATTAIVGTSSATLNGFSWKQYSRPVSSAFLGVDRDSTDLVFTAFREDTHRADVMPMSNNLGVDAECDLFVDTTVNVQNSSLTALNATVNAVNAAVTATDFSPDLLAADIQVEAFGAADIDVCDDGGVVIGDCVTPVALSISEVATGRIAIEFTSVFGCSHMIQKTTSLGSGVWIPVESINGDGQLVSREYDVAPASEFYRVVSQD